MTVKLVPLCLVLLASTSEAFEAELRLGRRQKREIPAAMTVVSNRVQLFLTLAPTRALFLVQDQIYLYNECLDKYCIYHLN